VRGPLIISTESSSGAERPQVSASWESPARLWDGVGRLIDSAPSLQDLRVHRLHLLAAERWRLQGRDVPDDLAAEERAAALRQVGASWILEKVRESIEGPLLVFKGAAIAANYPDPTTRPFSDIDLLVPDPQRAQQQLISAGFVPIGNPDEYYDDLHHLRPLVWPTIPILVEIHRHVSWVEWAPPPPNDVLFATAVDGPGLPEGVQTLAPPYHALVVAAHSWSTVPLRRALDLVDVAALLEGRLDGEVHAVAAEVGLDRLWHTTARAADYLLLDGRSKPSSLRIWGRSTADVRDPTVLEHHFRRWVSTYWARPPIQATGLLFWTLVRDLLPAHQEQWRPKLRRMARAFGNAFTGRSSHDADLGDDAHRFPRQRPRRSPAKRRGRRG
jgi:hypothetical protein